MATHRDLARGTNDQTSRLQTLRQRREQLCTDLKDNAYDRPPSPHRKVRRRESFDRMLSRLDKVQSEINQIESSLARQNRQKDSV